MRSINVGTLQRIPLRYRLRALLVSLGLLVLLPIGLYLRILLQSPTRTPLLVLSQVYLPPLDLNPWAPENEAALRLLDQRNLTIRTLDSPQRLANGQWSELEDWIVKLDHFANGDRPLLIYINLHGVVDANHQPFFLANESREDDPSTWISLETMVHRIESSLPSPRDVILLCESGRHVSGLPRDASRRSFGEAVRELVEHYPKSERCKSLSALISTHDQARSSPPTLSSLDPFTQAVVEGLSAEATKQCTAAISMAKSSGTSWHLMSSTPWNLIPIEFVVGLKARLRVPTVRPSALSRGLLPIPEYPSLPCPRLALRS